MAKIDRLGWAAGFAFKSYGLRVGVRVNDADALRRVVEHLPPGWTPTRERLVDRLYSLVVGGESPRTKVRRFNLLYGDISKLERTLDADRMFESFESNLRLYVAEMARRRVFVHAGVVGWKGRAVVIPGHSLTGKTTLVAGFLRAGASYYSDEFAVLDARGRVHPFVKPLAVRERAGERQKNYAVEDFGGVSGVKPLPVGLVVVGEYRPGARWRPRKLSPGHGMLALLDNTVSARRQPAAAFASLQKVVAHAPVLKGVRGEATEVVDSVLEFLEKTIKEKT